MALLQADADDYITWLQIHNYAATTITCRRRYLDYFCRFCRQAGIEEPAAVTLELIQDYRQHLFDYRKESGEPLSFATQAQRLIPVAHFFSWLRRSRRLVSNPAADMLMPKSERKLPDATLSSDEMARLLATPNIARPLGLRDRAVLEVFYSSALRRSELIALTIDDVDFARGTLFIRNGKGAKDRYVPVGERALFWLRLYLELARPTLNHTRNTDTLFISTAGTPICADWLSRKIRSYLAAAQIHKKGSCHLLRHTVATLMLEGGADIRYVAELLGHARLETTRRYTRVSIERLRHIHATTHPAAGLNIAMADEICNLIPNALTNTNH